MEATWNEILAENDIVTKAPTKYWKCWQLQTDHGRQVWKFIPPEGYNSWSEEEQKDFLREMSEAFVFDKSENPNSADEVFRTSVEREEPFQPELLQNISEVNDPTAKAAYEAACRGISYYRCLQSADGHWPGDYGGPMFLLPGLVIAGHTTQTPFAPPHKELMKRYMLNHQNADGGWGLHIEGSSTMFGTVMQYVSLRLLGLAADDEHLTHARKWIHEHGGATGIPPWGKFYLSVLGVYDWKGCDSLLPEMWLFPKRSPIHPSRYWCHARMVYLPMSYCYGYRVTGKITPLIEALREELYTTPYAAINWKAARTNIADTDSYTPYSNVLKVLNRFLINPYERVHAKGPRKKALDFALEYINAEDEQTEFVDIGPVNQVINSIAIWHAYGKDSTQFRRHVNRWKDYLWVAEDGMKMNGYNGSQLWDTAFAMQAILEGGLEQEFPEVVEQAYHYIDISQVAEDVPDREKFFRHISKGGWPFSTLDHGWPISDCTAEGISATLAAHSSSLFEQEHLKNITPDRLFDAVNVILSFQNEDGGWATYENTRSKPWVELLNPSGIFGDIMIDYSFTECSSACIRALCEFHEKYPEHRTVEIEQAVKRGVAFIKSKQLQDGSWLGSWAVCFTYGTWFGVEALAAASKHIMKDQADELKACMDKACKFLLSKQNTDGGWGESFESCVQKKYVNSESQVVNTSWALLSLMAANYTDNSIIEKGVELLKQRQQPSGDWAQENISGVFNFNCMITYTAYRNVFPIWALGRYVKWKK